MKRNTKLSLLFSLLVIVIHRPVLAGQLDGVVEGKYIPIGGKVETMEVGLPAIQAGINVGIIQPRQQGLFDIILERKNWSKLSLADQERIARLVIFEGVVQGVTDPDTFTTNHVLTSFERDAVVYTLNDTIIPFAGDLTCSQGDNLMVKEVLNIDAGMGRFAGIVKGGKIFVEGKIGNCPDSPSYLKNDFQVVSGEGGILIVPVVLADELDPILLD